MTDAVRFLDTNVILRHLLNDHPTHSPAAFKLFQAIETGAHAVWITDLVVAEVIHVLTSKRLYGLPRDETRDLLLPLLSLPGIRLSRKRMYRRVFDLYCQLPIDFIDAVHAAMVEHETPPELYSYDRHFDRVDSVRRVEPS